MEYKVNYIFNKGNNISDDNNIHLKKLVINGSEYIIFGLNKSINLINLDDHIQRDGRYHQPTSIRETISLRKNSIGELPPAFSIRFEANILSFDQNQCVDCLIVLDDDNNVYTVSITELFKW